MSGLIKCCGQMLWMVLFVGVALIANAVAETRPLNVVLLVVDDLGWTDVGCFGSSLYRTPNVDRLAREGVRFTNAYAPACSCSPSRAGIMTGKYPTRLGMTAIVEKHRADNAPDDAPLKPAPTRPSLPLQETTIAEVLKAVGYQTCLVGKWHLSGRGEGPKQHGFDVAIAPPHTGAPKSYFWPDWKGNPQMEGRFDGEYLTDRLADQACHFVRQQRDKPFFLYLPFHSVHVPVEAKQGKVEKYRELLRAHADKPLSHTNPYYAGMVESMDEAVGRLMQTLRELQLEDSTLVIFFSDNGGLVHRSHRGDHTPATSNDPLRGGKGFLYEGGIRVPLIMRWPEVVEPGAVCELPVHGCDLFPTICHAAGIDAASLEQVGQLDGQNLRPVLRDPNQLPNERTLFWHYPHFSTMGGRPSSAIRRGDWKLIEHLETGQRELFHLAQDIGESHDRSASDPTKADELQQALTDWRQDLEAAMPNVANPNYRGMDYLRDIFQQPPDEAKPRGYWVWPHGNFNYTAIRKELESFKSKGLGGVDIFDLGIKDRKDVIPPGPGFMSVEQLDGIAYALAEAKRLGLKMGLIVSSSWNAGGTWTRPEHASMNLVSWRETVQGPLRYERELPFPNIPDTFSKSYGRFPLNVPKGADGLPQFYQDVATVAFPVDNEGRIADPKQVRVLTDQVDSSGTLRTDLPNGRWVVMRNVVTNFGQELWVPSDNSRGLSIDHFSKEATRFHFQTIIDRLKAITGPLEDTALERLYLASYENNTEVIWTPGLEQEFARRNGYSLLPYLPALFGVTIENTETTERFLYDFRHTASELFLENLYREASRICRENGLVLCSESGGPGAPLHDVPTEDLKALGAVDVMRGEFWVDKGDRLDDDGLETLQIVKQIASAAHTYGHKIVEMESFTSHESWHEGPMLFKRLADRAFCEGMTRVVYHTMSHNLPEAGKPGWTYGAGSHMNTNLTWWDMSDQLHRYLARTSALLMQGHFVADVAYYYGHEVPNFAKPKHVRQGLGPGYDYDDLNTEVLLTASVDQQGRVVLPSGMRYRLLVLPRDDKRMDLKVLQHIEELLLAGATIIGRKPERTYGLRDHVEEDQQLRELADRIWGTGSNAPREGRRYGRGQLLVDQSEREVLGQMGIGPDLQVVPEITPSPIDFIHRRLPNHEIYFVRNVENNELNVDIEFRVDSGQPECWNPADGTMMAPAVYDRTEAGVRLPLHLPPRGSLFVVFSSSEPERTHITAVHSDTRQLFPNDAGERLKLKTRMDKKGKLEFLSDQAGTYRLTLSNGKTREVRFDEDAPSLEIGGPWEVRFPFGWGVPVRQQFPRLVSWTEADHPATQSFSGIAVYAKQVDIEPSLLASRRSIRLDLGQVHEVARVYLNGKEVGISSFTPHVLDVTGLIREGENSLLIEVANTWLNRLVADDSLPSEQRLTHTNLTSGPALGKRWRDADPKSSGLLGPVRLRFSNAK